MSSPMQSFVPPRDAELSIALVSPDRQRRIAASAALGQCAKVQVREFMEYPKTTEEVAHLRKGGFACILIDLDGEPERALKLVGELCLGDAAIVMVYCARADPELMLQSMRAGAREFLILPFKPEAVARALAWVAAQLRHASPSRRQDGRLLVFFGSKGGVGTTTLASNFAVALAEDSHESTLLIDLNFHLGDAALILGLGGEHSVVEALENSAALDAGLLGTLLVRHGSGLAVLAAPEEIPAVRPSNGAIGRLLEVARRQFDNVVVDAGKKIDLRQMHLFEPSATTYLVAQVGIPELRNANRLIAQFSGDACPKLEIVINRYQSRFLGLTDEHLNKALNHPVGWKIPNDYKAVREMENSGALLVHQGSAIAGAVRQMARSACGLPAAQRDAGRGLVRAALRLPRRNAVRRTDAEVRQPGPP